jgi:hypothetical protein
MIKSKILVDQPGFEEGIDEFVLLIPPYCANQYYTH